jgi:hypothetical protein
MMADVIIATNLNINIVWHLYPVLLNLLKLDFNLVNFVYQTLLYKVNYNN